LNPETADAAVLGILQGLLAVLDQVVHVQLATEVVPDEVPVTKREACLIVAALIHVDQVVHERDPIVGIHFLAFCGPNRGVRLRFGDLGRAILAAGSNDHGENHQPTNLFETAHLPNPFRAFCCP